MMRRRPSTQTATAASRSSQYRNSIRLPSCVNLFEPRTKRQAEYRRVLSDENQADIVIAMGPAGTAKTMGATLVGLEKLVSKSVDRLVLTRPAVSADEELGFLPGALEDKMRVWLLPVYDSLRIHMRDDEIRRLMASDYVEICSLSHMRGRTFRNSYVIIDECQNTTPSQMLMLLTRIGEGSKFVFTGDPYQHDRGSAEASGLVDFVRRWKRREQRKRRMAAAGVIVSSCSGIAPESVEAVKVFEFEREDVQRHAAIPGILEAYDDDDDDDDEYENENDEHASPLSQLPIFDMIVQETNSKNSPTDPF